MGINRDAFFLLTKVVARATKEETKPATQENRIRNMFGIGQEAVWWLNHPYSYYALKPLALWKSFERWKNIKITAFNYHPHHYGFISNNKILVTNCGLHVNGGVIGLCYSQDDGESWTPVDRKPSEQISRGLIRYFTFKANQFIAISNDRSLLLTSSDGIKWEEHENRNKIAFVAYNEEERVFLGVDFLGNVFKNADVTLLGQEKIAIPGNLDGMSKIHYDSNNTFVAFSKGINFCSEGKTWKKAHIDFETDTTRVCPTDLVSNGKCLIFIALERSRNIVGTFWSTYISKDGATWKKSPNPLVDRSSSTRLNIISHDGYFILQYGKTIYASANGLVWTKVYQMEDAIKEQFIFDLCCCKNRFFIFMHHGNMHIKMSLKPREKDNK
jgi:hypothetical protein